MATETETHCKSGGDHLHTIDPHPGIRRRFLLLRLSRRILAICELVIRPRMCMNFEELLTVLPDPDPPPAPSLGRKPEEDSARASESVAHCFPLTETGIMPLRIRRFLLLLSLAIWSISSRSNYLTLLVRLSKVQLNLWQLERSLGSGCAPCRGEYAILILDSTTRFGECYREKHVENWWKCALRNGCSRKSTNQINSTCCTEDANLKRTNLPFKKPFQ